MSHFRKVLLGVALVLGAWLAVPAAQTTVGNFSLIKLGGNQIRSFSGSGTGIFTLPSSGTDQFIFRATTDTLTNKTLNAESTGNLLTVPFVQWWVAAVCRGGVAAADDWNYGTAATDAPTPTCKTSAPTTAITANLAFDDSATEYIYRDWQLPTDWTSTLDLTFVWYSTATAGNVVWQAQTFCTAVGESTDETGWSYNAAQTVTDAAQGSASRQNTAAIASLTTTGCAAAEMLHLKLFRNPANASDTLGATASLWGVELTVRRGM